MAVKKQMKQNKNNKAAEAQSPKRVSRKDLRRKRTIKRVISLVALFAVIGVAFYFAMKMLFVVKSIEVSGSGLFTKKEIVDFIDIPEGENIFKIDSDKLAERITTEFTYLESAQVIKRMPDRIEIKLTDSVESYYTVEDECKIYSQGFKFLRNGIEPPADAVWLDLDMENPQTMEIAIQLIGYFEKHEMSQITKITITEEGTIGAVYADRFDISFGTMLDVEYKIKMCKKVLEEKISRDESGVLDATQAGEIVYKRQ